MMQVWVIILRNAFSRGRGAASLKLVCLARRHVHTCRSMGKRASRDLRTAHTSLKDQLIGWCAARVRTQNDKKAAADFLSQLFIYLFIMIINKASE